MLALALAECDPEIFGVVSYPMDEGVQVIYDLT